MEPVESKDATLTEASPPPQAPQKKERSQAQKDALAAARAKALQTRRENAELRSKEKAVKSHHKAERVRQVEEAYSSLPKVQQLPKAEAPEEDDWDAPIEELPAPYKEPKPKKRKPARRIVVTEVSSEEDDHSDVEVVLPKAPRPPPAPSAEEVHYQAAMNRMFHLQL
jgi:hypothetical protein